MLSRPKIIDPDHLVKLIAHCFQLYLAGDFLLQTLGKGLHDMKGTQEDAQAWHSLPAIAKKGISKLLQADPENYLSHSLSIC